MGIEYSIRIVAGTKNSKMKLTLALLAAVAVAQDDDVVADDVWQGAGAEGNQPAIARSGADRNNDERRYDDLHAIAKKVWSKMVSPAKIDSTKKNTGPMVAIASSWE